IGVDPSPDDLATHVVLTPVGPRLVQGYLVPLALVLGWIAAGRLGATLVVALAGAWAAAQTFLLLRETVADVRARSWSWLAAAFLAPVVALAPTVYPNVLGAAALVTAYRWLFTAPVSRRSSTTARSASPGARRGSSSARSALPRRSGRGAT